MTKQEIINAIEKLRHEAYEETKQLFGDAYYEARGAQDAYDDCLQLLMKLEESDEPKF